MEMQYILTDAERYWGMGIVLFSAFFPMVMGLWHDRKANKRRHTMDFLNTQDVKDYQDDRKRELDLYARGMVQCDCGAVVPENQAMASVSRGCECVNCFK